MQQREVYVAHSWIMYTESFRNCVRRSASLLSCASSIAFARSKSSLAKFRAVVPLSSFTTCISSHCVALRSTGNIRQDWRAFLSVRACMRGCVCVQGRERGGGRGGGSDKYNKRNRLSMTLCSCAPCQGLLNDADAESLQADASSTHRESQSDPFITQITGQDGPFCDCSWAFPKLFGIEIIWTLQCSIFALNVDLRAN